MDCYWIGSVGTFRVDLHTAIYLTFFICILKRLDLVDCHLLFAVARHIVSGLQCSSYVDQVFSRFRLVAFSCLRMSTYRAKMSLILKQELCAETDCKKVALVVNWDFPSDEIAHCPFNASLGKRIKCFMSPNPWCNRRSNSFCDWHLDNYHCDSM